jgi:transposase
LKERLSDLEGVVRNSLDEDVFVLKNCLRMIERLDGELREADSRIASLVCNRKDYLRRVSGVPRVAQVSVSAILAEIGDGKRFSDGKKIASWAGLFPTVYQTAEKNLTGRVKQGSRNLRIMMLQVANVAARVDCRLRRFFLRVAVRRGKKKAIVALARRFFA